MTAQAPPTFLVQAEDDPVHVENSIVYFMALKHAGVPAEMHIYAAGWAWIWIAADRIADYALAAVGGDLAAHRFTCCQHGRRHTTVRLAKIAQRTDKRFALALDGLQHGVVVGIFE